jgi:hypothetical protein
MAEFKGVNKISEEVRVIFLYAIPPSLETLAPVVFR